MDSENHPTLRSRLLTGCAGLVGMLVLYVLSVGPVFYVAARFDLYSRALNTFYAPLFWFTNYPPARRPIMAYSTWWWEFGLRYRQKISPDTGP